MAPEGIESEGMGHFSNEFDPNQCETYRQREKERFHQLTPPVPIIFRTRPGQKWMTAAQSRPRLRESGTQLPEPSQGLHQQVVEIVNKGGTQTWAC